MAWRRDRGSSPPKPTDACAAALRTSPRTCARCGRERTCCRPRAWRSCERCTPRATTETIATATAWTSTMTGSATAATCSATLRTCVPIPTPGSASSPSRTAFAAHGRSERARSRSPKGEDPPDLDLAPRRATRGRRQLSGRVVAVPWPVPRPQPVAADLRGRRARACPRHGHRLARRQRALPPLSGRGKRLPRRRRRTGLPSASCSTPSSARGRNAPSTPGTPYYRLFTA